MSCCCSGYNHPSNFGLHQFQSLPWRVHLMTAHNRVHSVNSCEYLHPPCLFITFKSPHVYVQVMLATMFWLCSKSSLHMCLLCSPWKHLSHSHKESYSLSCKHRLDQWSINYECCAYCFHLRSVILNMCVCMVWSFCRQVMWVCVRMITYARFDCSHT